MKRQSFKNQSSASSAEVRSASVISALMFFAVMFFAVIGTPSCSKMGSVKVLMNFDDATSWNTTTPFNTYNRTRLTYLQFAIFVNN